MIIRIHRQKAIIPTPMDTTRMSMLMMQKICTIHHNMDHIRPILPLQVVMAKDMVKVVVEVTQVKINLGEQSIE